jgi:L-aspartate oxidase
VTRELSALAAENDRVSVLEGRRATALLVHEGRCVGLRCDDGRVVLAGAIVLATGGAAALWARTTNPPGATGAGLLLARAAGASLADLELVQFHPTAVAIPASDRRGSIDGFLVTEAVRGEGALLLDAEGERFVEELAPRDEVARAIQRRMADTGVGAVGLDMRAVDPALFPNVVDALRQAGIDPTRELVPVAPAAHYVMGGIATDGRGRSTLPGLLAVGECACTGLHGANRLASNSLSECFVFGRRAAHAALREPPPPSEAARASAHQPAAGAPSAESRAALWRAAGLERDAAGLQGLLDDPHELVRLIARCALARVESRGAHQRRDAPETDPELDLVHVTVAADGAPHLERWV